MTAILRLAIVIPALIGCTYTGNLDPPAPDDLADRFKLIAFYNEVTGEETPLRRWADDVRVVLASAEGQRYVEDTRAIAETLDRLLPQSVSVVDPGDDANVLMLISSRFTLRSTLDRMQLPSRIRATILRASCAGMMFRTDTDHPDEINAAVVTIQHTLGDTLVRRCIAQELTQILGLPNDIDDPEGTVFSSDSRRSSLSEGDENLVRILYDPRIQPGMTRTEAMPIVRAIAAEIEAERASR